MHNASLFDIYTPFLNFFSKELLLFEKSMEQVVQYHRREISTAMGFCCWKCLLERDQQITCFMRI